MSISGWTSPVTYATTTSAGTSTITYVPYGTNYTNASASTSTIMWTVEDPDRPIPEPCLDCTDGTLTLAGVAYVCGACDGTGQTYHVKSDEL